MQSGMSVGWTRFGTLIEKIGGARRLDRFWIWFRQMQIAKIDSVDVIFGIFFPPIGTLIAYGGACAAARAVTGGQPLTKPTKRLLRYGSLFVLGTGYLISVFGIFKLPEPALWASVIVWGALVVGFALSRRQMGKTGDDPGRSAPSG